MLPDSLPQESILQTLINHRPPENSAYLSSKAEFLVSQASPKFHHLPNIYKTEFATLAASK